MTGDFSGDVRGTGSAVASPSTQTSAEFLTRAVTAIQANQIPGLENWQSAYVSSPSPGSLRLISDDAGVRTLSGFEFTTTTTRASTISGMSLGPHTGSPPQVFTDSVGDELFTVTRSDNGMPAAS